MPLLDVKFSKETKQLLRSPNNTLLRNDGVLIFKMGLEMRKAKEIVKGTKDKDGYKLKWREFIEPLFGTRNVGFIAKAMKISHFNITRSALRDEPLYTLYYQVNKGMWPENPHKTLPFTVKSEANPVVARHAPVTEEVTETYRTGRENKDLVENAVLNMARGFIKRKVNCLTLCCDRYDLHVNRLFDSFAKKVYIFEQDRDKLIMIYRAAKLCHHYQERKVHVLPVNASELTLNDCEFIDLDIEGSLVKTKDTVIKHAQTQRCQDPQPVNSRRVFSYTFSLRPFSREKTVEAMKDVLRTFGVYLQGFDGEKGTYGKGTNVPGAVIRSSRKGGAKNCKEHTVQYTKGTDSTKVSQIKYFTYDDGHGPMGLMAITYGEY